MPRPFKAKKERIYPNPTREVLKSLSSPQSLFSRCESAAFVRAALQHAINKDLHSISPYVDLLPTDDQIALGANFQRSSSSLRALAGQERCVRAALKAATFATNARVLFDQAIIVPDSVRPILTYYGGLSFLDFIAACLFDSKTGTPGHGLSLSCDSDGTDFDRNWPRQKCRIAMERTGDFPFYVDALTAAGWPSLLSGYRLHRDTKNSPWVAIPNPAPLLKEKCSLDYLCNIDFERYLADNPTVVEWLVGADRDKVLQVTSYLLDFVAVFSASSLARYYVPAWRKIVEAEKSEIYNDVREAYRALSDELPHFFSSEYPFRYSFVTPI